MKPSTSPAKTIPLQGNGPSIKTMIKVHSPSPTPYLNQGVVWKRLVLPWIALPSDQKGNDTPIKAFSKQLKTAEAYLRDAFPGAQIPQNLLKEHLFDSVKELDGRNSNQNQGELLGLGITRRTWNLKTGRKRKDNRWHELFVAFPSGEMRSHISICAILDKVDV